MFFQNSKKGFDAFGEGKEGLGYSGIDSSFAIEFDYQLSFSKGDPDQFHLSVIAKFIYFLLNLIRALSILSNKINYAEEIDSIATASNMKEIFAKPSYNISIKYFSSFYTNNSMNHSKLSVILDEELILEVNLKNPIEFYLGSEEAYYGFTYSYDENQVENIRFIDTELFVSN